MRAQSSDLTKANALRSTSMPISHGIGIQRNLRRTVEQHVPGMTGCPMLWKSWLQTKIALSSCESKHTGLSHALCDTMPIMKMLKEMKAKGFPMHAAKAAAHCKVFKDDSRALEIAKVHKF